jgi:hypothetical protein
MIVKNLDTLKIGTSAQLKVEPFVPHERTCPDTGQVWIGLGMVGHGRTRLKRAGQGWTELERAGQGWTLMDRTEQGWTLLKSAGQGWTELEG